MAITRRWSIARQLFVLQVLVVTVLVGIGTTGAVLLVRDDTEQAAIDQVVGIAEAVAHSPTVVDAVRGRNPSAVLQPYTESVRLATDTDFIVVMAPDRTRYTHTRPELIGRPFIGSIEGALDGGTVIETSVGTLGESVRAVVPSAISSSPSRTWATTSRRLQPRHREGSSSSRSLSAPAAATNSPTASSSRSTASACANDRLRMARL